MLKIRIESFNEDGDRIERTFTEQEILDLISKSDYIKTDFNYCENYKIIYTESCN